MSEKRSLLAAAVLTAAACTAAAAGPVLPSLSAGQILDKNAQARGGLAAWHAASTVTYQGKLGAGASSYVNVSQRGTLQTKRRDEMELPYTFEFKRPYKTRLELEFNGQKAVQVYDGSTGWKLRPFLHGGWDAYSGDENRQAAGEPGVEGYLLDAAAKGSKVELDGTERVGDQDTYRLKVTLRSGEIRRVWVDGKSFLDVRVEGAPRRLDGKLRAVYIEQRDFKSENGLIVPHTLESQVQGVARGRGERIRIDTVKVNAAIPDADFTKST